MPYYIIILPNDTPKHTNWDNLMPLAEYERRVAASRIDYSYHVGDDTEASSSYRHRSLSRSRGSSRHRGRERYTTSRQDDSRKQRSSSRGDACEDLTSLRESFGSFSSRKSSRSDSSCRSSPHGRHPRSPSLVSKREAQDERHHLSDSKKRSSRSKPKESSPSLATKTPSTHPSKDTRTPLNHSQSQRQQSKDDHSYSVNSFSLNGEVKETHQQRTTNKYMNQGVYSGLESSTRSSESSRIKKLIQEAGGLLE